MRDGAMRFASGDLFHRLPEPDTLEFSGLAVSMNQMAEQLQQRLDEITSQRKKTERCCPACGKG
jgi:two-component system phosphate regulon sensor histidine kinase PhoR